MILVNLLLVPLTLHPKVAKWFTDAYWVHKIDFSFIFSPLFSFGGLFCFGWGLGEAAFYFMSHHHIIGICSWSIFSLNSGKLTENCTGTKTHSAQNKIRNNSLKGKGYL